MEQNELNLYVNILQKRISEYFNQSLIFETKFQYQNEIIENQNKKIEELNLEISEYVSQIKHLDEQRTKENSSPISSRKKKETVDDGDIFS